MFRHILTATAMSFAATFAFAQTPTPGSAPGSEQEDLPAVIDANNPSDTQIETRAFQDRFTDYDRRFTDYDAQFLDFDRRLQALEGRYGQAPEAGIAPGAGEAVDADPNSPTQD